MTDIVERLRDLRGILDGRWPRPSQTDLEAADEIERLRKALQFIAYEPRGTLECVEIARAALTHADGKGTDNIEGRQS